MVTYEADVVVCGGGPAGVVAAIAAGRSGRSTILIERYGFVGGMSTAALVYPWMTFHTSEGKQVIRGIAQEIVDRLAARGASPGHLRDTVGFVSTVTPYNGEVYKVLAVEMLKEAGVVTLFHSFLHETTVEDGKIRSVRIIGKSGTIEAKGKVFIDATGDGDLAYLAGAPCSIGRDGDRKTQPMTMKFRMRGVDLAKVKAYMIAHPEEFYEKTPFADLESLPLTGIMGFKKQWREANLPINRDAVLMFAGPNDDEVLVNTTRVQGLDGTNVADLTEAEHLGRQQVLQVAEFMTKHLPGFEKASVSSVGAQIGIRETRRIQGLYTLTAQDVVQGRRFPDAIARSGYPIDIHDPTGKGVTAAWVEGDGAYDIPYRSLLPKGVSNLLAAGRCISTSHEAFATTRLTPSCMATGEAAGVAAAIAVREGIDLSAVDVEALRRTLAAAGAVVE